MKKTDDEQPNKGGVFNASADVSINADTKVWRIFIGLVLSILGITNVATYRESAAAKESAQQAQRETLILRRRVSQLTTNQAVVTMFLNLQRQQQKSEAKRKEFQDVINILEKPLPKENEQTDAPETRATDRLPQGAVKE